MNDVVALSFASDGVQTDLDLKNRESIALEAQYWTPASGYPEGESKKIRIGIKVLREKFELVEL